MNCRSEAPPTAAGESRDSAGPDQADLQGPSVLQIIERICAAHQEPLGFYPFCSWGESRRQS